MLCYVMCYVMLCYVMLCYVMLCYVMCYVMLCYVPPRMTHYSSLFSCLGTRLTGRRRDKVSKETPQKLIKLSPRSHPRHLVGKRTAEKDAICSVRVNLHRLFFGAPPQQRRKRLD